MLSRDFLRREQRNLVERTFPDLVRHYERKRALYHRWAEIAYRLKEEGLSDEDVNDVLAIYIRKIDEEIGQLLAAMGLADRIDEVVSIFGRMALGNGH